MKEWTTYSNPQLSVTLKYPQPTPLGHSVKIVEKSSNISYRIHLLTDDSSEIYFEIGRYLTLPIKEAVNLFQTELKATNSEVDTSPVEATTFAAKPAYRLTARWPEKERSITFVDLEGVVCRIIYDPASAVNQQILETLSFN
jgi:hypothetical protein